jgi:peroxiredoxin
VLLGAGLVLSVVAIGATAEVLARRKPPMAPVPSLAARALAVPSDAPRKHVADTVHFDLLAKLLADDRRAAGDAWLEELADPLAPPRVATQSHPLLGQSSPDFTLVDQDGKPWHLHKQLDQGPVVLVFYLGYFCNACVHDLFELNADLEKFGSLGAQVVAISADSSETTRAQFQKYGKFGFTVLSDPEHVVAGQYGLFQPAQEKQAEVLQHGTFILSREGQVRWVSRGDTPFRANNALLWEVAVMEQKLPADGAGRSTDRQGVEPR